MFSKLAIFIVAAIASASVSAAGYYPPAAFPVPVPALPVPAPAPAPVPVPVPAPITAPAPVTPPAAPAGISGSCNAGPVQCCNNVKEADTNMINNIQSLFGVTAPGNAFVGFQCSPISGAGAGSGANCATQPVCCSENHYEGLVAVGCNPISGSA